MRNEKKMMADMTPKSKQLFSVMKDFREHDIAKLFHKLWPAEHGLNRRRQQQRVGAVIHPVNKVLGFYDLRILPGNTRGTYRLVRVRDRACV